MFNHQPWTLSFNINIFPYHPHSWKRTVRRGTSNEREVLNILDITRLLESIIIAWDRLFASIFYQVR